MLLAMASPAPTIRRSSRSLIFSLFFLLPLLISTLCSKANANENGDAGSAVSICIVGSGIGGSSVAHFLRRYSPPNLDFTIRVFERNGVVGGRMATVNVSGQTFEAGASILHPRNLHALNYTKLLNLTINTPSDSESSSGFAIWDGHKFVFKTLSFKSKLPFAQKIVSLANVAVVATPLDELSVQFTPPISIPKRELQHTHATFVRGLLNPVYFGLNSVAEIPELVGTIEDPDLPFSCISVLKQHNENDFTYKIFSRKPMADATLDSIFSVRTETIRINWGAYPHYNAPEVFAPFILDGQHLYYVNAFENAASTMETSAAAAENVARLILSRFFTSGPISLANLSSSSDGGVRHVDL